MKFKTYEEQVKSWRMSEEEVKEELENTAKMYGWDNNQPTGRCNSEDVAIEDEPKIDPRCLLGQWVLSGEEFNLFVVDGKIVGEGINSRGVKEHYYMNEDIEERISDDHWIVSFNEYVE